MYISTRMYPGKKRLGVSTLRPPRISTTTSVGMRISPISSCSPYAWTRCRSDSETFFSKPEYVWTMYHCFGRSSIMPHQSV